MVKFGRIGKSAKFMKFLSSGDCNFVSFKYFGDRTTDLESSRLDLSKKSNRSKKYSKLAKLQPDEKIIYFLENLQCLRSGRFY